MKVALAQLNPVVGDVPGNTAKVKESIASAAALAADLVVFSELSTVGYPARDLLEDPALVAENVAALHSIARDCPGIAALVGFVRPAEGGSGPPLEDAAALLADGEVRQVHVKALLPNYDVYDDPRHFRPGPGPTCWQAGGRRFGVAICEDLWDPAALGRDLYGLDPIARLMGQGVELIVNIAASGFQRGKARQREELLARQARRSGAMILYVNQVGGNDDMVFDGGSCAVSAAGELVARAASFREDLLLVDTDAAAGRCEPLADEWARLAEALKLGLRDYVRKGGFRGAMLALAGDVGSAVVAALAADALGGGNVRALAVRDRGEEAALADVRQLAGALGIDLDVVSIDAASEAMEVLVNSAVAAGSGQVPAEQIRSRLCGDVVSACAAAGGRLSLATADKTDLALGLPAPAEAMEGALAPIGDVLRRDVPRLAEHLQHPAERIPRRMLQAGGGSLDGPAVDEVLRQYIEQGRTVEQMAGDGIDGALALRTVRRVDRAESRRRGAPLVLKVTPRAFGAGRRVPVARRQR